MSSLDDAIQERELRRRCGWSAPPKRWEWLLGIVVFAVETLVALAVLWLLTTL